MAIDHGAKTGAPFARGSVSLRLYPHNELDAGGVVNELCTQARLGLDAGFDGIMTSEHHGGVGGYIPNPFQMASFVLEDSAVGWTAACPLLLPLRPTALVAEEAAWLAARHPGRVGLGVAAGAMELDFTAMGLELADAVPSFKRELGSIVAMLQGRDLRGLDEDRALQQCKVSPIPVLSAAVSLTAAAPGRCLRCGDPPGGHVERRKGLGHVQGVRRRGRYGFQGSGSPRVVGRAAERGRGQSAALLRDEWTGG